MKIPDFYTAICSAIRPRNERELDNCREISEHLADFFHDQLAAGESPLSAERKALSQINLSIGRKLRKARGGDMRDSYTKVLFPGAISVFAVSLVGIALEQGLHVHPKAYFIFDHAAFIWYWYMMPVFFMGGLLGAWLSRLRGGSKRQRLNAGLFLVEVSFCAFVLPFVLSLFIDRHVPFTMKFQAMLGYCLSQVIVPGIPMVLGTVPFLRGESEFRESTATA